MERPAEGREGERPREPHLSPAREDARAPFCIRVDPRNQRFSFPLRVLCDLSLPTGQAVGLNRGGERYGIAIKRREACRGACQRSGGEEEFTRFLSRRNA